MEESTSEVTIRMMNLSKSIDSLIEEMKAVTVGSQDQYDWLTGWLRRNKESQKAVDELFKAEWDEAKSKCDEISSRRSAFKSPLVASEGIARDKMSVWATAQEKKRRKEAADRQAEALKRAEDDRLVEAQNLSSMGRSDAASSLLDKKLKVAKVETETRKPGKVIESWSVEVTDKSAFLQEAVCIPALLDAVDVSTFKVSKFLKDKGQEAFPGLKVTKSFRPVL